ncbi:hypothetical protein FBQ87_09080 [Sphingobacteriales bacterium CHB3]|nr:hypothetical protein [Sphingobacteriales bacterium CHB3]
MADKIKKSPIKLESIELTNLNFSRKSAKLRRSEIPPLSMRVEVSINEKSELLLESTCDIILYGDDDPRGDFQMELSYRINASTFDSSHKNDLEKFAKFGSPFNALVFARETVAQITFKAFGKAAMIPLLDVHGLGKSLIIKQPFNVEERSHDSMTQGTLTDDA